MSATIAKRAETALSADVSTGAALDATAIYLREAVKAEVAKGDAYAVARVWAARAATVWAELHPHETGAKRKGSPNVKAAHEAAVARGLTGLSEDQYRRRVKLGIALSDAGHSVRVTAAPTREEIDLALAEARLIDPSAEAKRVKAEAEAAERAALQVAAETAQAEAEAAREALAKAQAEGVVAEAETVVAALAPAGNGLPVPTAGPSWAADVLSTLDKWRATAERGTVTVTAEDAAKIGEAMGDLLPLIWARVEGADSDDAAEAADVLAG